MNVRNTIIKFIFLVLCLLQLLSCGRGHESSKNNSDTIISILKNELSEIKADYGRIPSSSIIQPREVNFLEDGKMLVVADFADKTISLINLEGKVLSKIGGEGRGPREFQNIAQLHVGYEGHIYILDMILFRITVFGVNNNTLNHVATYSYKNPPNYSLQSIYKTSFGNFGVYNQSKGFQTSNNKYLLYSLDKHFDPVKKLLEMPGNKRQKVTHSEPTLFMPSIYLQKTLWDQSEESFYYSTSHQEEIYKYNLKNGFRDTLSYIDIPQRLNSPSYISFMKTYYNIKDSHYWEPLENSKKLPLFSGFWVNGDEIIRRLFYPANKKGMMIYIKMNRGNMKYFSTPYEFTRITFGYNKIYGINLQNDDYSQLMFLDFNRIEK